MKGTFFTLSMLIACGGGAVADTPAAVDPAKVAAGLKTADAADGTEDKVVHKCAGCALNMDGSADHTISHNGYTLHMCSTMCKAHFEKDLATNLSKLAE